MRPDSVSTDDFMLTIFHAVIGNEFQLEVVVTTENGHWHANLLPNYPVSFGFNPESGSKVHGALDNGS